MLCALCRTVDSANILWPKTPNETITMDTVDNVL